MFRLTPLVKNLLIINVAVFLVSMFLAYSQGINLNNILALYYPLSDRFFPFQYFTYMFAHSLQSFTHILFNMIALVFIGPLLENLWGPKKFLSFYILTGVGAALIYTGVEFYQINKLENKIEAYIENPSPELFDRFVYQQDLRIYNDVNMESFLDSYFENPESKQYVQESINYMQTALDREMEGPGMVGASGAIYGLLMALAVLFPNLRLMLLIPPIPVKAKYLAMGLAGISIYLGLNRQEGDMVAHFAHLGGMIVAFILIKFWQRQGTSYR